MTRKLLTGVTFPDGTTQTTAASPGIIPALGSAPSSPATGQQYFNTSNNLIYTWNGTIWTTTPPLTTKINQVNSTAGAGGTNMGDTNVETTLDTDPGGGFVVTSGFQASAAGAISSLAFYVSGGASPGYRLRPVIYNATAARTPTSLLWQGPIYTVGINQAGQWVSFGLPAGYNAVLNNWYHIGWATDQNGGHASWRYNPAGGNQCWMASQNIDNGVSTTYSIGGSGSNLYSVYAVIGAGAAVAGSYTAASGDFCLCDCTYANCNITLPTPTADALVVVKKRDSSTNAVVVTTSSGTIDGGSSISFNQQNVSYTLLGDGTNWWVI